MGPARPASAPVFHPRRRRQRARLALDPRHRRRPSLHEELVGPRPPDRLRAHLRSVRSPTSSRTSAPGKPTSPTFREALQTQAVCDAVLDSAAGQASGRTWCLCRTAYAEPPGTGTIGAKGRARLSCDRIEQVLSADGVKLTVEFLSDRWRSRRRTIRTGNPTLERRAVDLSHRFED